MATVAEQLRRAREAAGLTRQQVADITKMRADRVIAIEQGNYDTFTAPVYIRGFVRTYARVAHADETAVMAALDEELAQTEKFREHPSLTGGHQGALDKLMLHLTRINWRVAVPAGVVIVLVVVATVIYRAGEQSRAADPLQGVRPGVYQPTGQGSGDTLPLPPAPR